ncbi:MAG: 50S ribosomal protein L3 [Deltaproteobacteria bacterium HGW-Deltaproteobacteria-17]|nr:MAG: 50S ribosomal protein L3 [Deltaproteobacteria bacterium HGW-Deltaproteobacteria-17]
MAKMAILGKKLGMTQIFTTDGNRIPVTVVEAGPNVVLSIRTPEINGYSALQLAFDDQKPQRVNKPDAGQFKKANVTPKRFIREVRLSAEDVAAYTVGQTINAADIFRQGDPIDVTGITKGKGFQGVMKRHNFRGAQTQSHGTHEYFRHGGSIGCRMTPGRVHKGKRMGGHMGSERVTIQNLKVAQIRPEENIILVQGAIPGAVNGYVTISFAAKKVVYL